jgi:hypothetical protein
MSVIADIDVPPDAFPFGETLASHPDLEITLDRIVPLGESKVPYFWARDDDEDRIEQSLRRDPHVEDLTIVDRLDGEILVKVEWNSPSDDLFEGLVEVGATIQEATGTADRWSFRLRFDDYDGVNAFYRWCADHDIAVDLRRIHNPAVPEAVGLGIGLTDTQRETLLTALDEGYFAVPRETNLVTLAEELGISDTALSQRLRRGLTALLTATLHETDERDGRSSDDATTER